MSTAADLTATPSRHPRRSGPQPAVAGSRISPVFRVELRRRHDERAPVEQMDVRARTIASARHAARLAHPDAVILSVARL